MATLKNLSKANERSSEQTRPLKRNRDYLLLIGGQGVSEVGSQISLIAFPLLMFALTHSALQAGLMTSLRSLPYALFTLPAGVLVDRWDRKRLMIFCDLGRALALGSIPVVLLLGHLTYIQLYLVSLIEGTLFVFFSLAEAACLPRVVGSEQLAAATSQDQSVISLSRMLGPALAPVLYGIGQTVPFLADAVSYTVSVISLCFIKTRFQSERRERALVGSGMWTEIKEGVVWLWKQPLLRFIAILSFGLNTPCYGYVLIFIVLAQHMHASNTTLGLIFAGGGLGSLFGALVASPLYKRLGLSKMLIGSAWIWALFWLFYAFVPDPLWLGIVNVVSFLIVPIYTVVQYSYRLSVIPDHLQGRVNSVYRLIALSGQPLGIALTGLLLQVVGPINAIIILFIPQGVLALVATFNRSVRQASLD